MPNSVRISPALLSERAQAAKCPRACDEGDGTRRISLRKWSGALWLVRVRAVCREPPGHVAAVQASRSLTDDPAS